MDYWITNADSLLHQIFMIVMGSLYAFALLLGVSYKAVNIYCYFVLFPLSFSLFLKGWKKFMFFPISLLFFLIPGFEAFSTEIFQHCVILLNKSAAFVNSNYVAMSVYLCVLFPLLLYILLIHIRFGKRKTKQVLLGIGILSALYMMSIYPFMKTWLLYFQEHLV
jgi:hypothetical protein